MAQTVPNVRGGTNVWPGGKCRAHPGSEDRSGRQPCACPEVRACANPAGDSEGRSRGLARAVPDLFAGTRRDSQPRAAGVEQPGEVQDLAGVVGGVVEPAEDGQPDAVRLAADVDRPAEVGVGQAAEGVEEGLPAAL